MDIYGTNLCCSCLSSDRKMILVDDFWKKQCFLQIISEIPITRPDSFPLWLCWECEAQVNRFMKFKKQVKESCKLFQECVKQNIHLPQKSKLKTHKIINLTITPESATDDFKCEIVKQELNTSEIKEEQIEEPENDTTNYSEQYSDDDNTLLIDISNNKKNKKITNGHTKKKRKKAVLEAYREMELNEQEIEVERRLLELKEEYVNAMFKCERCIVSFPNADDLKDHENIKHDLYASHYKCNICECSFATEVSYNYHTNKHRRRYVCVECEERFASKRAASKHYESLHCCGTDLKYEVKKCDMNGQNGQAEALELGDESTKADSPSFPCEYCDKTFRWKTSLRKHMETHRIETGQKRKPYCEPCKLSFTTTSNLQKHVKTSSKHQIQLKLRKLSESLPGDSTSEKQQAHIEQIKVSVNSKRQTFPCGQCDKRFQWRGNLLRHLHSHAARANGELVCEPCNRTFSSIATYKQHMKISRKHVTENDFKYVCSNCGKRFANKTRLEDHVNWEHLKNYTHKCPVCQKVFKSHTSLYLHKQVVHNKHNAEHLCDHCGKAYPNHAKLRSHIIALHTIESPYKCTSCSARFSWHSCLSRHIRRVHRAKRHK